MTDDVHAHDDGLDGGDAEALWEPEAATDEVRSLERRLLRHRHQPRAWVVPDGMAQDAGDDEVEADATWMAPRTVRPVPRADPSEPGVPERDRQPVWRAQGSRRARVVSFLAAAAVLLFFLGDTLGWFGVRDRPGEAAPAPYVVEALEGLPEVQRRGTVHRAERLDVEAGDRLLCDAGTRAALHVADAGMVRMEPGTELRVDSAPADGWRLYLERGQVTASIFAAPRLFQVGTPSGIAVDLGCVYTATVGEDGETILSVRGGQVSFETERRKVFVPDGARVVAWPGRGPGTPVWDDASAPLRKAVARLDELSQTPAVDLDVAGARGAIEELDRLTEARDSLTLWHLLDHPHPQVARAAFDRLVVLSPPPPGVDAAEARARRPAALALWRETLEKDW